MPPPGSPINAPGSSPVAALDVLPRMTDGAYDMVLVDADKEAYPAYVEHALRLLRPGGVLVLDNMLWHDRVADPAVRDETTTVLRDLGKALRDDDRARLGTVAGQRRSPRRRASLGGSALRRPPDASATRARRSGVGRPGAGASTEPAGPSAMATTS